jgi:hypothetical protein
MCSKKGRISGMTGLSILRGFEWRFEQHKAKWSFSKRVRLIPGSGAMEFITTFQSCTCEARRGIFRCPVEGLGRNR